MGKVKLLIIIFAIVVFCFVPVIEMPYEVVVQKQISEEYTIVEHYTVQEEVQEPYTDWIERIRMPAGPAAWEGPSVIRETVPIIRYRTVTKEVTKYREVTKTRLVTRPFVETQTKRVSILRYLLR